MKGNRVISLILLVCICLSIMPSTGVLAETIDVSGKSENLISEKEFLNLIKDSELYNEFKDDIDLGVPSLFNPVIDDDQIQVGYIAQYEVEYNNSSKTGQQILLPSVLIFVYDSTNKNDKVDSIFINYSEVLDNDNIEIKYSSDEELDFNIDINEHDDLNAYFAELKNNLSDDKLSSPGYGDRCWVCTEYETGGGTFLSDWCNLIVGMTLGTAIAYLDKKGVDLVVFSSVIIGLNTVLFCYVPKYKICVDGYWSTVCPIPTFISD